ncbi:MAG: isopentenyl-diphosphate delta-isomerase, type 2 [Phycisphaerales bacterium]|nr:isopentenyl-diphosphate delta-isomerase, type 2 [Phycisphaerales bacterium]
MASSDPQPDIRKRKADHLALVASGEVDFREKGTLLDDVTLVHHALPEMHFDEVDLSTELFGKRLRAPVLVAGMTGGTPEAAAINRDLARAAEALGLGFGVGSQRAMALHPDLAWTYQVREVAPTTLIFANIGMVQARRMATAEVRNLVDAVGADALCVHLNPAMELVQPGGDRDFRGGVETMGRLSRELGVPVIAKETGAGISRAMGKMLKDAGVAGIDVSGAGGTSWVGVETRRAAAAVGQESARTLGEEFWDWGIPTAASVALNADLGLPIIATGGLRSGTDVARAIALGAIAGGLAAPVLKAQWAKGYEGALRFLESVVASLKAAVFLCGCKTPSELRKAPKVMGPRLAAWVQEVK